MRDALIIVGPSCVGKTTVANELLCRQGKFELVRSATTRAPRGDGNDGEYIYLTREEFFSRVESGEMLEYMEYGDNLYGTPISELERIFALGKIPLLILDINGVKSVRKIDADFRPIIFYVYSDVANLERRLYERYLSKDATGEKFLTFAKRKEANLRDYRSLGEIYPLFDAFIKNTEVRKTADDIMDTFSSIQSGESKPDSEKNREIALRLSEN